MPVAPSSRSNGWLPLLGVGQVIILGFLVIGVSGVAKVSVPNPTSNFQEDSPSSDPEISSDTDQILTFVQNDPIDEHKIHVQSRRQADGGENSSPDAELIDLPKQIFDTKVVGSFQLALKSNESIVAVVGSDNNIYLSNQAESEATPSTFSLVDLGLPDESYVGLIQDAKNQRYLHAYNDIQANLYCRVRTNLETKLPCHANVMFWTFVRGYLQLFRGENWFYDTAGCLDSTTGLVKVWLVNGQQGLTALQGKQGECGLAPLVAINYS